MTKEIIQKVSEIMELAVNFNSSATMQELTDDKPTFFVVFSGLICGFEVRTNINGYPKSPVVYLSGKGVTRGYETTYLDGAEKQTLQDLDTVLAEMRRIINEWEVTQ